MESPFYLDLLTRGAKVWNERRQQNPTIRPDLIEADLRGGESNEGADRKPPSGPLRPSPNDPQTGAQAHAQADGQVAFTHDEREGERLTWEEGR
jgi:hypothetical protein